MDHRSERPRHHVFALGALTLYVLMAGCARGKPPADSLRSATLLKDTAGYGTTFGESARSVFTDTALFRRVCTEADSGMTARTAGKCTPRDQSLRPGPRPRPPREP
jgi:hypothetical protein